uniref:Deacetylase sirtuin-type domain-containing protein n=1 Tax=Syphacia muris TaxID=451379 RepID=A0A0N5AZB9_9BILA
MKLPKTQVLFWVVGVGEDSQSLMVRVVGLLPENNLPEMSEFRSSSSSTSADNATSESGHSVNVDADKRLHLEVDFDLEGLSPSSSTSGAGNSDETEKKLRKDRIVEFCYRNFSTIRNAIDGIIPKFSGEHKQLLSSLDIDGFAELIRNHKVSRILIMCGAGISTSAGIPDFRSPGSGLYDNLQEYHLTNRLDIFNLEFFKRQPEPFFSVARKLFPKNLKVTFTLETYIIYI